jgi:hypothetical protein
MEEFFFFHAAFCFIECCQTNRADRSGYNCLRVG